MRILFDDHPDTKEFLIDDIESFVDGLERVVFESTLNNDVAHKLELLVGRYIRTANPESIDFFGRYSRTMLDSFLFYIRRDGLHFEYERVPSGFLSSPLEMYEQEFLANPNNHTLRKYVSSHLDVSDSALKRDLKLSREVLASDSSTGIVRGDAHFRIAHMFGDRPVEVMFPYVEYPLTFSLQEAIAVQTGQQTAEVVLKGICERVFLGLVDKVLFTHREKQLSATLLTAAGGFELFCNYVVGSDTSPPPRGRNYREKLSEFVADVLPAIHGGIGALSISELPIKLAKDSPYFVPNPSLRELFLER